ncbi:hypothetical protein TELCIR_02468 [Teladorsagia circumcincta]|uniref:G-protein coupled receptors family 1 profile domain-containing protein n=1 Tax=Teladorsagia circumcincta TaxID=45464 RepID=A0A2G9UZB8_TELCI|nr:hypothetical protein TELCIR_02468 [Teladorsagia circumcincta]
MECGDMTNAQRLKKKNAKKACATDESAVIIVKSCSSGGARSGDCESCRTKKAHEHNTEAATVYGFCKGECIPTLLYTLSYYMCYLNSSCNPFAYAMANRQFRLAFVRILKGDFNKSV